MITYIVHYDDVVKSKDESAMFLTKELQPETTKPISEPGSVMIILLYVCEGVFVWLFVEKSFPPSFEYTVGYIEPYSVKVETTSRLRSIYCLSVVKYL